MTSVWIDGEVIDSGDLDERTRVAIESTWAPTARLVLHPSWLSGSGGVDGPSWIKRVGERLGYSVGEVKGFQPQPFNESDRVVVFVGPRLEDLVAGPKTGLAARVVVLPLPVEHGRSPDHLHLLTSPWRRNHHSPASSLLLASDAEYVIARREALGRGGDEALVLNLDGWVASAGRDAVIIRWSDGRVTTPPLSDGAPATPWRDLVLGDGEAVERSVMLDEIRSDPDAEVVLLAEDGTVVQVAAIDHEDLAGAEYLAAFIRGRSRAGLD